MKRNGQVMILTIMILGGVMIGASTIAGLLTVFQIREATDITNTTKAIYAADTGVEWELFKFTQPEEAQKKGNWSMSNGTEFVSSITLENTSTPSSVKSIGSSGGSNRAFEINFIGGNGNGGGNNPPVVKTYSYERQSSFSGSLTPRCSCDSNASTQNCLNTFSATEGDPAVCYDRYVNVIIRRSMRYNKVQK